MKNTFCLLIMLTCIMSLMISCSDPTEACFTYSPTIITRNTTVTFDASCSENVSFYSWDFGDGTADTMTTSFTVTHRFFSTGQFNVTLQAKRKDGVTLGKDKPITTQTITVQ